MRRERYTIAVMPFSGRRMRTFSFSISSLVLILFFLATVVSSLFTYGSLMAWKFCKEQKRMAEEAVQKCQALQKELQEIRKNYADFRGILGIEMAKPDDYVGRGGPQMPELKDVPTAEMSAADEAPGSAVVDLSSVLKEAASLNSDLKDLAKIANAKIAELVTTPSIWPIKIERGMRVWISSKFGPRRSPFSSVWEMHEGLDISAPCDTPIIATANGTIAKMERNGFMGNLIEIRHSKRVLTLYGHMSRFAEGVEEGSEVKRGDVIGYVGRTGNATGCHIHYEVRTHGKPVNPIEYILN